MSHEPWISFRQSAQYEIKQREPIGSLEIIHVLAHTLWIKLKRDLTMRKYIRVDSKEIIHRNNFIIKE